MTPEREAEIRATIEYSHSLHHKHIEHELLEEIDRLRSERRIDLSYLKESTDHLMTLKKDRDALLAENEKFRRDYDKHDLILENDRLKARMIKLRSVVEWCIGVLEGMNVRPTYLIDALSKDDEKK